MIMMRVNLCVCSVCVLFSLDYFSVVLLLCFYSVSTPFSSQSKSLQHQMSFSFLVFTLLLIQREWDSVCDSLSFSFLSFLSFIVFVPSSLTRLMMKESSSHISLNFSLLLFTSCLNCLPVFFAFIAFVCFSLMLSHFRFRLCCISCWICFASHLILRQGLSFQSNTHLFLVVDWLLTCKVWSQLQFMCTFSRFLPLFAKRLNGRKRYSFCPEPCFLFLWFILTLTPSLSLLLVIHLTTFREKGKWLEERKDNWTRGQETSVEASRERTLW